MKKLKTIWTAANSAPNSVNDQNNTSGNIFVGLFLLQSFQICRKLKLNTFFLS